MWRNMKRLIAFLRHPFNKWERLYFWPNPYKLDNPSAQSFYKRVNEIIEREFGLTGYAIEYGAGEGYQTEWLRKICGVTNSIDISKNALKRVTGSYAQRSFTSKDSFPNLKREYRGNLVTACEILYYLDDKDLKKAIEILESTAPRRIISYSYLKPETIKKMDTLVETIPNHKSEMIEYGERKWKVVWW